MRGFTSYFTIRSTDLVARSDKNSKSALPKPGAPWNRLVILPPAFGTLGMVTGSVPADRAGRGTAIARDSASNSASRLPFGAAPAAFSACAHTEPAMDGCGRVEKNPFSLWLRTVWPHCGTATSNDLEALGDDVKAIGDDVNASTDWGNMKTSARAKAASSVLVLCLILGTVDIETMGCWEITL